MSQLYTSPATISTYSGVTFRSGTQPFTICGYFRQLSPSGNGFDLCFVHDGTYANLFWIGGSGTNPNVKPVMQIQSASAPVFGAGGQPPQDLNVFHHLALVYDGTSAVSYYDGVVFEGPTALTGLPNCSAVEIGYDGNFIAQDVMIYQAALTQVQVNFVRTYGQPPVPAFAWWQMANANPTLDSSGNGHALSNGGDSNGAFTVSYSAFPGNFKPTTGYGRRFRNGRRPSR